MIQDNIHFAASSMVTICHNRLDFEKSDRPQVIGPRLLYEMRRLKEGSQDLLYLQFAPNERCLIEEDSLVDIRRRAKNGQYYTDVLFFEYLIPLVEKVRDYAESEKFNVEIVKHVVPLYVYLTDTMAV